MTETSRRRVLVVEDEPIVAMLVEDLLQDFGCQIAACVTTAEEAEELAREMDIDFALLDVNLGGTMSFGVADALNARGVPFAFLTGYGVQGVRADLRESIIIHKPVDPDRLKSIVESLAP
ncbi:MAG: response regulator [Caulobacteraceae bacterium]